MTSNIMLTLLFLAAVLIIYYLAPKKARGVILLAASLVFYASADIRLLLLAVLTAAWSFFAGVRTENAAVSEISGGGGRAVRWFILGIVPAVGVLFVYKYFDFFTDSVSSLLKMLGFGVDFPLLGLVMPLGISYYTFKMISYNADIFMGRRKAEGGAAGFCAYLTYVLFFPQILSGPIERSEGFLATWHEGAEFDSGMFAAGLQFIVLGLFKKMVIANRLSTYVDTIFDSPGSYPGLACIMAAVFYSIQIYCDFSGYSDIAAGMSEVLGYRSVKNFDRPYFSRGIKEFWSRWHMSLSGWLKDYIYIPLGGNRVSGVRHAVNIIITFLVSGLWHGAAWNFIFWGLLHGLWNLAARKAKDACGALRRAWQTLVTFLGVTFCWIFFRADSISSAFAFIRRALSGFSLSYASIQNSVLPFTGDNTCAAYFVTVCVFIILLFVYELKGGNGKLSTPWAVVMTLSVVLFGSFGVSGFLYAGF